MVFILYYKIFAMISFGLTFIFTKITLFRTYSLFYLNASQCSAAIPAVISAEHWLGLK